MLEQLAEFDTRLMLALNGSDSLYMDGFMRLFSSTSVWIPVAIVLLVILFKNNRLGSFIAAVLMIALTVFLCDRLSSGYIKPMVGRLRPSNEPLILDQIVLAIIAFFGTMFISDAIAIQTKQNPEIRRVKRLLDPLCDFKLEVVPAGEDSPKR